MLAYRPTSWGPRLGQGVMPALVPSGFDSSSIGIEPPVPTAMPMTPSGPNIVVPGAAKAVATVALVSLMVPAVASAYVGFRLGSIDKGLPQALGYVVGVLGGLGAFGLLLTTVGVLALPSNSA